MLSSLGQVAAGLVTVLSVATHGAPPNHSGSSAASGPGRGHRIDIPGLTKALQAVIDDASVLENRSYSFAVALPPPPPPPHLTAAAASEPRRSGTAEPAMVHVWAGANDRSVPGSRIGADSLFPAGSATKPTVAVSALLLASAGRPPSPGGFRLDLDAPAVPIADSWLAAQGLPTVTEIWAAAGAAPRSNRTALQAITTRQLLSMTSGILDYNDTTMRLWTEMHPAEDIAPLVYLTNMSHTLPFVPGKGSMYSGNGFVMAGMVLAAATGAKRWQDFDQLALLDELADRAGVARFDRTIFMTAGPCSRYPRVVHQYAGCWPCESPDGTTTRGVNETIFYDLFNESCLNGWTMGNIAVAPQDVSRFYHLLAAGVLLSQDELAQMQQWHYFSAGWNARSLGMEYGMGLMLLRDINRTDANGDHPTWTSHWGHPGADWGSQLGIPPGQVVGYWPALNASMTLASNTLVSMNSTAASAAALRQVETSNAESNAAACLLVDTVARFVRPKLARLRCYGP